MSQGNVEPRALRRYNVAVCVWRAANGEVVEVEVMASDKDEACRRAIADLDARQELPSAPHGLCHHCANNFDLGDEEFATFAHPITEEGAR